MATPTEPTTTEPTGALFRALRSVDVDPDLAYRADDEVRAQAGQNVITAISAQFTGFRAELDTRLTRIEAEIKSQTVRIEAQSSRIDVLQRVIWPLIVLLVTTVFGLLYKAVTG